jgi:glutamate dehydrogenase
LINTDAIDGSASRGVSDDELNLTILIDAAVAGGELSSTERAVLLGDLRDDVAGRALRESHAQALALSLERRQAASLLDLHARLISLLESRGVLAPELALLPDQERLRARKVASAGLCGPELAVLFGHAKIGLRGDVLDSDLPEDHYLREQLVDSFPAPLRDRFRHQMRLHPLRREIIAADLVNTIVDSGGMTFVSRLAEETGAATAEIARAFAVAIAVFEMEPFWRTVQELEDVIDQQAQASVLLEARRLVTRAARWLLRNRRPLGEIAAAISAYGPGAAELRHALPELLDRLDHERWAAHVREFAAPGVPRELAARVALMDALFFTFDIVESAHAGEQSIRRAAAVHYGLDRALDLAWLRNHILDLPRGDVWQALARAALRDKLYENHRQLTTVVVAGPGDDARAAAEWLDANRASVARYLGMLRELQAAPGSEFTTLLVAVRELGSLVGTGP